MLFRSQGLLHEVEELRARGDLHADLPSMRCVGYRQCWEMLDTLAGATPDALALQRLRDQGIAASRQLAKRQLTWLRSMTDRHVLHCDQPDLPQQWQRLLRTLQVLG